MTEKRIEKVALLGAMPQEIDAYSQQIKDGYWHGKKVDVDLTGVGKPAAAATTAQAISRGYDLLLFTGVAGSLDDSLEIGDISIVRHAIDADLDVRPWDSSYKRGEIPFTRERVFQSDPHLARQALRAPVDADLVKGYVATGSVFANIDYKTRFNEDISPELEARLCGAVKRPNLYDMETSAVLQIANKHNAPALVIRAVSDTTRGDAPADFNKFVENAIDSYVPIVDYILKTVDSIPEVI